MRWIAPCSTWSISRPQAGIDIANDGEQQRVGFQTYVPQRMSGFAGESKRRRGRDYEEFPELVQVLMQRFPKRSRMQNAPEAQAELHYLDTAPDRAGDRAAAAERPAIAISRRVS